MQDKSFFVTLSIFSFVFICPLSASAAPAKSCPDGDNSQVRYTFSEGVVYQEITCSDGTKIVLVKKTDKNAKIVQPSGETVVKESTLGQESPERLFLNDQHNLNDLFPGSP
jgi:hypothetical protein